MEEIHQQKCSKTFRKQELDVILEEIVNGKKKFSWYNNGGVMAESKRRGWAEAAECLCLIHLDADLVSSYSLRQV